MYADVCWLKIWQEIFRGDFFSSFTLSCLFFLLIEFIQPQNLWPYIQQNLIQQNHLTNPAFIAANNHHHSHHLHHNTNSLAVHVNGINNNNGSESNGLSCNNNNSSPEHHAVDSRDNKVIAKPLPSRPFMHHGINHPHLHSLLAHCRNPYMTGRVESRWSLIENFVKFCLKLF